MIKNHIKLKFSLSLKYPFICFCAFSGECSNPVIVSDFKSPCP